MAEATVHHLLVVDDEVSLLQLMEKYLARLGYTVDACSRAQEALKLFEQHPKSYSLVMADLSLPDMSGDELVRKMLELNPGIRILVCSGYPFAVSTLPALRPNQISFLQKPFLPRMLAEALGEMFGEKPVFEQ